MENSMSGREAASSDKSGMTYQQAVDLASREEGFKATVYAMNTLLLQKGIYGQAEFRRLFTEWVEKEERKKARLRAAKSLSTKAAPR
jgi:hypothetical protein